MNDMINKSFLSMYYYISVATTRTFLINETGKQSKLIIMTLQHEDDDMHQYENRSAS